VDLDLYAGEVAILAGDSGSGKSRLLRALADLDAPDSGRIALQGRPAAEMAPAAFRTRVAYLPAHPRLGTGTVASLLQRLATFRHRGPQGDPRPLMDRLGLPSDTARRPVEELSTGEALRLTLALLLAKEPKVLLLDEPTAALDPRSTAAVEQVVAEQAVAGAAVLWVSHAPDQAARQGHCLYRLHAGRLAGPYRDPEAFARLMPHGEEAHEP
jgi:ABC-type iron transport system FetAB ATPase subunit